MKAKITYYLSLVLLAFSISAHAQFTDDFSDGDFTFNPTWGGDVTSWEVLSGQLHSTNSTASSKFYLSTPSSLAGPAQWEFWVNLKLNTSSANYVNVFLTSDSANLNNTTNGYFVQLGNTADEISLYKKSGATSTKIIDGADGTLNHSNNIFKIKITRDAANLWTLQRDSTGTGNNYVIEGTVTDGAFSTSNYFGLIVTQSTSSFFGKHYFDDFYVGPIITDTIPPAISSVNLVSQNQLDVYFSEGVDSASANTATNYSANNGVGNPSSALRDASNNSLVHLSFAANFPNGIWNTLTVTGVKDFSGNAIVSAVDSFIYVNQFTDDFSDGDFTNNPTWSGNNSDWEILNGQLHSTDNIANDIFYLSTSCSRARPAQWEFWTNLQFNTSSTNFVNVFLTSDMANLTGNNSGYYVMLGNTTDEISLYKKSGASITKIIDGADGALNHSNNVLKIKVTRDSANAWTLWRDTTGTGNFYVSEGTGTDSAFSTSSYFGVLVTQSTSSFFGKHYFDDFYVGPIVKDTVPPQLTSATVISPDTIRLFFNEPMDSASLTTLSAYSIDNGIGNPVYAKPVAPNFTSVILALSPSLSTGTVYAVTVGSAVKDKAGNSIGSMNSAQFAIVQSASANDIVINEVMFDPNTGGAEWVEIYNRSTKAIDLRGLNICNMDTGGTFTNIKTITSGSYVFFPENYLVLSKDQNAIKSQYNTTNPNGFIDMSSFISLSNDSAYVVLIDSSKNVIDKLYYSSAWHLPLLSVTKGISLERISYDNPTQVASNWHSAAESVGGATPAYKNSQYTNGEGGSEITISPEIFSPDNDGYNDVLSISYAFDMSGMIGNVQIYDSRGRLEKNLVRNELLATSGTFFWDGINDEKLKSRIGIYIVYFEAFDTNGTVKKYKKSCVVGGKL